MSCNGELHNGAQRSHLLLNETGNISRETSKLTVSRSVTHTISRVKSSERRTLERYRGLLDKKQTHTSLLRKFWGKIYQKPLLIATLNYTKRWNQSTSGKSNKLLQYAHALYSVTIKDARMHMNSKN